VFSVG